MAVLFFICADGLLFSIAREAPAGAEPVALRSSARDNLYIKEHRFTAVLFSLSRNRIIIVQRELNTHRI